MNEHDEEDGREVAAATASNVVHLPITDPTSLDPLEIAEHESIEALKEALDELRVEIRTRLHGAPEAVDRGEEEEGGPDLLALFDELRHRAQNFGISERTGEVDDFGFDTDASAALDPLIDFMIDRYWRVEAHGLEHVPRDQPCLFVANRSGLLPYDGLVLARLLERAGFPRPRFLVADWLITLPFAQPALARHGGVRACRENADGLLRTGRSVIAFPEGEKGAAKVFRLRYQMQRFGRGGAVRAAIENGVPLVPVGLVGPEEAHPILFKSRLPARLLGLPFVPVTPTFPLAGPLGLLPLPSKWMVHIGAPFELGDAEGRRDPLMLSRLNESVRDRIQSLVDEGLTRRSSVWG